MTKFCIELEGVMLPDAIAAVVEAWYDAQNTESFDWVTDLRMQIKREFGRGWTLDAVQKTKLIPHGLCRLTKNQATEAVLLLCSKLTGCQKMQNLFLELHIEFVATTLNLI